MSTEDQVIIHMVPNPDENQKPTATLIPENSLSSGDELPPAPSFVRQKSKEEVKQEEEVMIPLASSLRRQRSFDHTLRPAPFLVEQPKSEYERVLRGMGFNEGDIQQATKDFNTEKAIEDVVRELVEKNERSGSKEDTKETKGEEPDGDELPKEPLILAISASYIATDWKCRNCGDHMNSKNTEVCIQCGRARALCEELTDDKRKAKEEEENKKKKR